MNTLKKILIASSLITSLIISGCGMLSNDGSNNNGSNDSSSQEQSQSDSSSQGGGGSSSGTVTIEDTTIRIIATNDIHGQIYPEASNYRVGVGKLMTFVKNEKETNENAFLIDSGDTWQGSIYSNYNHGACITDIMNYVQYDARTIGNHDFDWGVDYVKVNTAKEYNGYKTPVLGGNIYDFNFETKTVGTHQQSDMGVPSVTYTLNNGMKVGILGVIGSSQITSINSLYTRGIAFTDHINTIKSEATKLRNEGCQFVICSIHAGQGEVIGHGLENYVDLVLCGHTHKQERYEENGLLFAQFGQYTEGVGYIELHFDASTQKVSFDKNTAKMYKYYDINNAVKTVDPTIQSIIDRYAAECNEKADVVYAKNVVGNFYESHQAANLMCNAVYDFAHKEGYDVDFAYCNLSRHDLGEGSWTYANIFEAFPFDNVVYIVDIPASEYADEVMRYNNIYKDKDKKIALSGNQTIKMACLDYLAWHNNASRYYDYFPSIGQYSGPEAVPVLSKTYREILCDWLVEHHYNEDGYTLYSDDYQNYLPQFDKTDCEYDTVTITYHLYDNVTVQDEIPILSQFEYWKIANPIRDGFVFDYWCFDPELKISCDNFRVEHDIDVYAKWRTTSANYYSTEDLTYFDFVVGTTSTTAVASNSQGGSVDLVIDHSEIFDNSEYGEFSVMANGFFHINIPSGYTLYSFSVDQFRYHNLEFFECEGVDYDHQLNISYSTPVTDHTVYSATGLELTDLYIRNSYSGKISFYSMQFTLEKINA